MIGTREDTSKTSYLLFKKLFFVFLKRINKLTFVLVKEIEISKQSPKNTNLLAPAMTLHKTIEKSRSMPDIGKNAKKKQRSQV